MYRNRIVAIIAILAVAFGIVALLLVPRHLPAEVLENESIKVGDSVRQFRLVVPHSLSDNPAALVVAFHGMGDSPQSMASYSELDYLAAEHGFLLVYPAASRSRWATLNIELDDLQRNTDIQFFEALVLQLSKQFNIDQERIYVAGMSNGAAFAQLLASARPGIAAVLAHSGSRPREVTTSARPYPVMLIVGSEDRARHRMESLATHYREQQHSTELVVVPGLGHSWSWGHNEAMWEFLSKHRASAEPADIAQAPGEKTKPDQGD